jgi:gamma-glutamylcyclotransferase (GGCT)/AIG2-like uncharacterized protein YtfP
MKKKETVRVFVYGTLRPGQRLYQVIRPHVISTQLDHIQGDLYFADSGWYPVAVDGEGTITGLVLRIPKHVLSILDRVEGHPDLFERRTVTTASGTECEAYFGNNVGVREKIDSGDFVSHMKDINNDA